MNEARKPGMTRIIVWILFILGPTVAYIFLGYFWLFGPSLKLLTAIPVFFVFLLIGERLYGVIGRKDLGTVPNE